VDEAVSVPLQRLIRKLERTSREWGRDETGAEPLMSPVHGACEDRGAEPYLMSFRVDLFDPELGYIRHRHGH
jgi:hypothetical protein